MKDTRIEKYKFEGKIWKSKGVAGWHFVTLPITLSKKIRKKHGANEEGWGRLKATATVGKTEWTTAIWFDTKADSYILPIKASVRKAEELRRGLHIKVILNLKLEHFDRKL